MKRTIIIIITALGVCSIIGGVVGIYVANIQTKNIVLHSSKKTNIDATKSNSFTNSNSLDKTNPPENPTERELLQKENPMNIFLNGGQLYGTIANNINVVINLNNAKENNNKVLATEYYTQYPKQILNVVISNNSLNRYTINESYKGKATGTYNINVDGSSITGTFKNISTGDLSNVRLSFKNSNTNDNSKINTRKNKNTLSSSQDVANNTVTLGFIRNIVSQKVLNGCKIVRLSKTQQQQYKQDLNNNNLSFLNNYKNQYDLYYEPSNNLNYDGTTPNSAKLGKPNFIINGVPVWLVFIQQSGIGLAGGNENSSVAVGANGKVYSNEDFYNAALNNNCKTMDEKGVYVEMSPKQMAYNFYHSACNSNCVLGGGGESNGLITSITNPFSTWAPPKVNQNPNLYNLSY